MSEKVAVFNSLAYQGKQLERKTNDAALKRAMLGREEAESEMRRYREESRSLRRQVEEGRERERRVGERLEGVMVCFLFYLLWFGDGMDADYFCRRTTVARRKHMLIHKLSGKRRSVARGKSHLRANLLSSRYKRS